MKQWQRTAFSAVGLMTALAITPVGGLSATGAEQVSGSSVGAAACTSPPAGMTVHYVIPMEGNLDGCIYGTVTGSRSHPSGTYQETADEIFVGSYGGRTGTFRLTENFTAKFGADTFTGAKFGRCQHPIIAGSGTGGFEGVTGRVDFKDDVDTGNVSFTGHLRFN